MQSFTWCPTLCSSFHHLYQFTPNNKSQGIIGSIYFKLYDNTTDWYPILPIKDLWYNYYKDWFYSDLPEGSHLRYIESAAISWTKEREREKKYLVLTAEDKKVVGAIATLVQGGLTSRKIILNFLKKKISPLKKRVQSSCDLEELDDSTRDQFSDTTFPIWSYFLKSYKYNII